MWEYSYRDKSGAVRKDFIEASTRSDAMSALRSRGVSVVGMRQVKGAKVSKGKDSNGLSLSRLMIILFVIVGVCLTAWMILKRDSVVEGPKEEVKKISKKPPKKVESPEKKARPSETNKVDKMAALRAQIYVDEKGVRRWPGGLRVVDAPPTYVISNANDIIVKGRNINRQIFKHPSENQIAGLLKIEIGETVVGTMRYGERFVADFKKSLQDEIEITDEDSEEDRILKEAVIETKKELLQRMEAGEDIGQIMTETRKELQDIARYRQQMRQDLIAAIKDENMTEKDIDDFVAAANQLLNEKNAKPLSFPSLLRRKIQMRDFQKKGVNNEN
jgi:hypothetical protein